MKTIWILWWLWPETTSIFYLKMNDLFKNNNIKYRPSILIYNTSIDLNIEEEFLLTWNWLEKYLPYLKSWIDKLINWWADFIVIPCNSVHWLIEEIRTYSKVPVLSIIDETVNYIKEKKIDNIWILSSWYTAKSKLYENKLLSEWIKVYTLWEEMQNKINNMILKLVLNEYSNYEKNVIKEAIDYLYAKWANKILLWCTDLQIITPKDNNIFDSMEILLNASYKNMI